MSKEKQIVGEVNIKVEAGLYVDDKTFRTCMNLAAIHAQDTGLKGMVVYFEHNDTEGYSFIPLETDEQCSKVWDAAFDRNKEEQRDEK